MRGRVASNFSNIISRRTPSSFASSRIGYLLPEHRCLAGASLLGLNKPSVSIGRRRHPRFFFHESLLDYLGQLSRSAELLPA